MTLRRGAPPVGTTPSRAARENVVAAQFRPERRGVTFSLLGVGAAAGLLVGALCGVGGATAAQRTDRDAVHAESVGVAELDSAVGERADRLDDRETDLDSRESDLTERETTARTADEAVKAAQQQVDEQQATVDAATAAVTTRENDVTARENDVSAREAAVAAASTRTGGGTSTTTTTQSSASAAGGSTYYKNCDAARAAGAAPVRSGDPGYRAGLDRDGDGIGCE